MMFDSKSFIFVLLSNELILEYFIAVLSHLCAHPGCYEQIIRAGGVMALFLYLEEHRQDLPVTSRSIVALRRVHIFQLYDRNVIKIIFFVGQILIQGEIFEKTGQVNNGDDISCTLRSVAGLIARGGRDAGYSLFFKYF